MSKNSSSEQNVKIGRMETLENIKNNLATGVYQMSPRKNGRSKIWEIFGLIERPDGSILKNLVHCRVCKRIYKFNGKQTSNLTRHKCCRNEKYSSLGIKLNARQTAHLTQQQKCAIKEELDSLSTYINEDKKSVLEVCAKWIVKDHQPFKALKSSYFKDILQLFMELATKYGSNMDVEELLPDPVTVSRHLSKMADQEKCKIKEEVAKCAREGNAAICTDLWTDNIKKRNYLCTTIHYIIKGSVKVIVLGIKSMSFPKTTGDNILEKIRSTLLEYDINDLSNITFVTKRGLNISNALSSQTSIICANHMLNEVLDSAFEMTYELHGLVKACKELVKYFEKESLQALLLTAFKNPNETHFISQLHLFKSISINNKIISDILREKEELSLLNAIDFETLATLTLLCENFEKMSRKFQSTTTTTINFVLPSIHRLQIICQPSKADDPSISSLKQNILHYVNEMWIPNLNIIHKVAVFLYAPTVGVLAKDAEEIKSYCLEQMRGASPATEEPCKEATEQSSTNLNSMSVTEDDELFFFGNLDSVGEHESNEIDRYRLCRVTLSNFEPIEWWETHKNEYPLLYKLAIKILGIPASCAASERVFEFAGHIITEKRNKLLPKTVDNILFLDSVLED